MKLVTLFTTAALAMSGASAATDADYALVLKSAPTSNTCTGATFPDECITNNKAAGPIIAAYEKYKLTTPGEQANVLAWMAYETGDFKYNRAHFGDTPAGKGTRCMMSPTFNAEFAKTVSINEADPKTMLEMLINDGHEFETCAWYLSTKCDATVKKGVQDGTLEGHKAFMTKCVQTTIDDKRLQYWKQTAQAFGLSGN